MYENKIQLDISFPQSLAHTEKTVIEYRILSRHSLRKKFLLLASSLYFLHIH